MADHPLLGDRLGEVFKTGINCVMVGNYLTTAGTQSFTIPAPDKSQPGPVKPVIRTVPGEIAEMGPLSRLVPVSVTWDPAELGPAGSPALDQCP